MPERKRKNKKIRNCLFLELNKKLLTILRKDPILCIRLLLSCVLEDVVLINRDHNTTCHFHLDDILLVVETLHSAIDATAGDDLRTFLQRVLELAYLFLFLLLGTDHEEPHDSEECHQHDEHTTEAASLLSCLSSQYHCIHLLSD